MISEITSKGGEGSVWRAVRFIPKTEKLELVVSFFFLSFNRHGVILCWNLWDVCSSNLASLIRHWFTIYSELAAAQVPWLYLVRHTPAHNICQNMWPPRILFSLVLSLPLRINLPSTTTSPAFPPSIPSSCSGSPRIRGTRATWNSWWQTETLLSMRSHSQMSVNIEGNTN